MVKPTADPKKYRPAAGVAIFNAQGQVWLGRRAGEKTGHVWQMPQGGIDKGEDAETAALREMYEETGISPKHVSVLGRVEGELFYDFPDHYRTHKRTKKWRGQRQSWFALSFTGSDAEVDIKVQTPQEFSAWRWGGLSETPGLIVPFKRKVYEQLVIKFAHYAKPLK